MDWQAIKAALVAWIAEISGVDSAFVRWENESQNQAVGTKLFLSTTGETTIGIDEIRAVDNGDAIPLPNLVRQYVGQRTFTLRVRTETHSQTASKPSALQIASTIRTKAPTVWSLAMLRTANLGFIEILPTTNADRAIESRMISGFVCDVRFSAVSFYDDVEHPDFTIEQAEITSEISGFNEELLADSIQLDEEIIP